MPRETTNRKSTKAKPSSSSPRTAPAVEPERAMARLRRICAKLPDTVETQSWGHPNFKTAGRTYAVIEKYKGEWCIALQAPPELREHLLEDARFYVTPFVGHRGWVSLRLGPKMDWSEVQRLVTMSHEIVGAAGAKRPRRAAKRTPARRG